MDQYIGKLLDNRYEILELIGVGGMAKVYKARCHRLNRLVAIKILRDDLAQDAEFRRRFHDESQAVAMLSHPNIVAVYDVSRSSEFEYIVMELIDGITLKQYMQKKGGQLNWREALHFITQIVKALGHAHSRGIIHRDIKPHNIMVLRDGSVKVADFGIARLASSGHSTLTQEALGSVHYISPEQARGSHIDARSDLYSAGVVLYEMITGRLPFEGDTPVSVAIQHINSIPLSPRELNPDIPEALEKITMKAMAPNPDDRYISADAMLADLEEFRKNPNINFDYNLSEFQPSEETEPEEKTQVVSVNPVPRSHPERRQEPERRRYHEEGEDREERRAGPSWPIYVAVVVILLFTAGIFYFLYTTFLRGILIPAERYSVPSLIGQSYELVVNDAELLQDFRVTVGSSIHSDEEAGVIIDQSPEANTLSETPDAEITVTVSLGPEDIIMQDVEGMEYREARAMLEEMGLSVPVPEYRYDDDVPYNHVISFTPLPETVLHEGDEVHLVVSQGRQDRQVAVPNVVGQSQEDAKAMLDLFNLEIGSTGEIWSDAPAGQVVEQNPTHGEMVSEGTKVNLILSKGPDPNAQPQESTKTFAINLPTDPMEVHVMVMEPESGAVVLDETVDSSLEAVIPCTVTGSGTVNYEIYFDGVLQYTETVNFDG